MRQERWEGLFVIELWDVGGGGTGTVGPTGWLKTDGLTGERY